jgi:hypothetical protein
MDPTIDAAVDRAQDYSALLINLFKGLDAPPEEALTSLIITSALIARGLDLPRTAINEVITSVFDDVYSLNAED